MEWQVSWNSWSPYFRAIRLAGCQQAVWGGWSWGQSSSLGRLQFHQITNAKCLICINSFQNQGFNLSTFAQDSLQIGGRIWNSWRSAARNLTCLGNVGKTLWNPVQSRCLAADVETRDVPGRATFGINNSDCIVTGGGIWYQSSHKTLKPLGGDG